MPLDIQESDHRGLRGLSQPINEANPRENMQALLLGNLQMERNASRICLSRSCIKFNPSQSVSLLHCVLCGRPSLCFHIHPAENRGSDEFLRKREH